MMRLRSIAAGLAVALALVGTAGVGGCAGEYDGYGWSGQPTSPESAAPASNGTLTDEQKEQLIEAVTDTVRSRAFAAGVDFAKWPDHLKKHKKRIDDATTMSQFSGAINRALSEFGISHIDIMSPRQVQAQRTNEFGGIGVTRDERPSELGIKIIEVREGGPAAKAGVQVGDIIAEVNGKKYEYESIRGTVGTDVKLKIIKADSGKAEELTLTRVKISAVLAPRLIKVSDETAVVRIDSFTEGYKKEVVVDVMKQAADYPYLLIDLRSNGGGSVDNFIHFLSTLLPRGTKVGTFISRQMVKDYQDDTGTAEEDTDPVKIAEWTPRKVVTYRVGGVEPYKGKVAVLINRGSASASEIVAAAMRELHDAVLVGDQSAGAVLMSRYMKMSNGFEMKVPTSDYVTIKGLRIEGSPLQPDVRVRGQWRSSADVKNDKAILAAIEAMKAANGEHAEEPKEGVLSGDGK